MDINKVVKSLGLATANKLSALSSSKDTIHLEMMKHTNALFFLEVNRAFKCHLKKIIDFICTTMIKNTEYLQQDSCSISVTWC